MRSRVIRALPARLEATRQRFELWRRTRRDRGRIPERLWMSAVKLAATYGLCRTGRTLGLDYNALKQRLELAGLNDSPAGPRPRGKMLTRGASTARTPGSKTRIPKSRQQNPAMTFVELSPLERPAAFESIVELEHPHRAKMRFHLIGRQSPEMGAALSRVFLGAES